jgi:aerobic-type carbon monoxide dehydrogenase small subunit (CoxS/CutS family)
MSDPSRRDFLAAGAVASVTLAADLSPPRAGTGPVRLTVTVNDAAMTVSTNPRHTLLNVLRDQLDIISPRPDCRGEGCGACTVLLDGQPVYSCTVLALEAEGRRVTTSETLLDGGMLDRIARAFVDEGALQPEAALAARAVFDEGPAPTPAEVEKGLAGVCPASPEAIRRAILRLCPAPKKGK